MFKPLKRKRAVGEDGALNKTHEPAALKSEAHQSTDIHHSWEIPSSEGFKVSAHPHQVIISQKPVCAELQTVILTVDEAILLKVILLSAIEAAQRKVTA